MSAKVDVDGRVGESPDARSITRRGFVLGSASAAFALGASGCASLAAPRAPIGSVEPTWLSATELLAGIARRELSPVEVVDHYLERIERLEPQLHAYVTVDAEGARAAARQAERAVLSGEALGRLHGLPISIKDLVATRGLRTTQGSAVYREFVPKRDEIQVARLRRAGAIVIGKTNTAEFGGFTRTKTLVAGETRNPWNLDRISGASSGGAGAAVAAGITPWAIGSDGGGSTRIPACYNGVFGMFPSTGRIPMRTPRSVVMSSTGPMSIHVRDSALILEVISGFDARDPSAIEEPPPVLVEGLDRGVNGLRIAWTRDFGQIPEVDVRVVDAIEAEASRFESLGARVDAPRLVLPDERAWNVFMVVNESSYRRISALVEMTAEQRKLLTPPTRERIRMAESYPPLSDEQRSAALEDRAYVQRWADDVFERFDLICSPVFPFVAPRIPEGWDQPYENEHFARHMSTSFTYIANILGLPAASVPCGFVDGMPIGLQIIGRRLDDAKVMQAAQAYSTLRPWMDEHPAIAE